MRQLWTIATAGSLLVMTLACASAKPEDQILTELANLDKTTIYERAEALFTAEKYEKARKYFSFLYDTFPNDPLGHKAALRIADTHAVRRDSMSLTEARLRYRDFANRYPNDPDRDYALLMLGQTFMMRKIHPDRDLTSLQESLAAYQQLINLYPDSKHIAEARERMATLRGTLAEHEWLVARFYLRNRRWLGAQWRLQFLKENYAEYQGMAEVDIALDRCHAEIAKREAQIEQFIQEQQKKKQESEEPLTDTTQVE